MAESHKNHSLPQVLELQKQMAAKAAKSYTSRPGAPSASIRPGVRRMIRTPGSNGVRADAFDPDDDGIPPELKAELIVSASLLSGSRHLKLTK
jgi:hypothetical protein